MLTFEDCLVMAGLSAEEAAVIAAHEHLPETLAVELGNYLRHCPGGERCIRMMVEGEIEAAAAQGDAARRARLRRLLRRLEAAALADPDDPATCRPKLMFPGRHPLRLRACAICQRHHHEDSPSR
jgi:hypothetical protein